GSLDLAARAARHHRRGDHHHVVALLGPEGLAQSRHGLQHEAVGEEAGAVGGGGHDHERGVALLDGLVGVHGGAEALFVGGYEFVELRLDNRHLASVERIDQDLVYVKTNHAEAATGEHSGKWSAQLAEADHVNARKSCRSHFHSRLEGRY